MATATSSLRDLRGPLLNYFHPGTPQVTPGLIATNYHRDEMVKPEVTVVDARNFSPAGLAHWKLEEHGFCVVKAPEPIADFLDPKTFLANYVPRLEALVKELTKADRVFYMSNQYRTEDKTRKGFFPYAYFTHSDFGPEFEPLFRKMLVHRFGVEQSYAEKCGVCCLNFWVPIERPAYDVPIALLDSSSIADLEKESFRYQNKTANMQYNSKRPAAEQVPKAAADAPGLAPNGAYAATHRWVFCPDMQPTEAWVFKQFDWRKGVAAKVAYHSAVKDGFHQDPPGRRSIDCRLVLCYDVDGPTAFSTESKL